LDNVQLADVVHVAFKDNFEMACTFGFRFPAILQKFKPDFAKGTNPANDCTATLSFVWQLGWLLLSLSLSLSLSYRRLYLQPHRP
jgi:hypothetical protein